MKRNLRMLSFFMALLMVCLCIPVVALDSFATGDSITQTEHDGTDAVSNDTNLDGTQVEDMLLEDVSKRDAFTKHYDLGNGSYYAVVFPEQVHYFENDQWVEIDNSLQYNSASGRYESANQIFSTGFAPNATAGDAVSVTNGDYTVSWSLIFEGGDNHLQSEEQGPILAQPIQITNGQAFEMNAWELDSGTGTIGKAASSVTYADLQNGSVDVRYSVYHGKVKEDVILESADALTSYALVMDTDGLIAIQNDDNSVSFVDAQGEVFFTMGAPWMQDSDAGVSHDVAVEVMQKGNQAIIAYTPSAEWLQAEERVYPVLIDPSFTANYYTCNIVDTYVYTGDSASATRANESILRVGYVNSKTYAAYMKFENLPDFSSYAVITDAQLDFYVNTTSSPELSVYEADGAWDPATITYANQPLEGNMLVYSTSGYATGYVSKYSLDLGSLIDYAYYERGDVAAYLINDWDGLKIIYEGGNEDTSIFSAQYTTNMDYRPTLRLTYTYYPGTEIANGAVYSFKNAANGEYMTVNSSSNYTSAVLASKSTTLWKQSFRLAWDSSVGAYNIHALTTSGQSTSYVLSGDSDIVYSDYAEDLYLYQKQTSRAEDQAWVIDYVQNGLYRIINAAHPELAVTGCTNDDYYDLTMGIAYEGNVCIMPYTGATNQLWRLESGGQQMSLGLDVRNSTSFEMAEYASRSELLCCPVMDLGDTVTWSSTNMDVATIDANGNVTALSAGSAQLKATVTKANGTTQAFVRTIYVVLEDGLYYFNAMGSLSSSYRIECDSTENVTVPEGTELILKNTGTGEPTTRAGLFKIRHLGADEYSIRSMLDNRMGLMYSSSDVYLGNIGTSTNSVPTNARWIISINDSGYYIRGANTDKSLALPNVVNDGVEVGWSTYNPNYLNYNWFITKSTQTMHGVKITQKTDTLALGNTFQFGAVFYSTYRNANGQNLVWDIDERASIGSADIDSNGVLTPISTGTVTVTVAYTGSSIQQRSDSCIVHIIPIAEGIYYFSNKSSTLYLEANVSNNYISQQNLNKGSAQLWELSYAEDGFYQIQNIGNGLYLTSPNGTTAGSNILMSNYNTTLTERQLWEIQLLSNGACTISSKGRRENLLVIAGTADVGDYAQQQIYTSNSDCSDEWVLTRVLYRSIYHYIDQGYLVNHNQTLAGAVSEIDMYQEFVANVIKQLFLLDLEWSIGDGHSVSKIDLCKGEVTANNLNADCCGNSEVCETVPCHNRSAIIDYFNRELPSGSERANVLWSNNRIISDSGINRSCKSENNVYMLTTSTNSAQVMAILLHEVAHLFGARDHYHETDPQTGKCKFPDICSQCNGERSPSCIMNDTSGTDLLTRDFEDLFCEYCYEEILVYISKTYR